MRQVTALFSLALILGLPLSIQASSIRYQPDDEIRGLRIDWHSPRQSFVENLSQGGSGELGRGYMPPGTTAEKPYIDYDGTETTKYTIASDFNFTLRRYVDGINDPDEPYLEISGHVTGRASKDLYPTSDRHTFSGEYGGTATLIAIQNPGNAKAIPQSMLDLVAHPERVHVHAGIGGSRRRDDFVVEFRIDPSPVPVPEPTTLVVFTLACVFYAAGRLKPSIKGIHPQARLTCTHR